MKYHVSFYFFVFIMIFAEFSDSSPPIDLKSSASNVHAEKEIVEKKYNFLIIEDEGNVWLQDKFYHNTGSILVARNITGAESPQRISDKGSTVKNPNSNRSKGKDHGADSGENYSIAPERQLPLSGSILAIFIAGLMAIVAVRKNLDYIK